MKSIEELEVMYNKLQERKYAIIEKMEAGKLSEEDAQLLYEPVSKKAGALYIKIEKMKAEQYNNFINAFM